MDVLLIVLITLISYSAAACIGYFITGQDDKFLEIAGLGVVGWIIFGVLEIVSYVVKYFKYRYNKRSIIEEKSTGNRYICDTKDTNDIVDWMEDYKIIKRYATRSEYKGIPYFSKEFIEKSKINCDHCKYDEMCYEHPRCKHDDYAVLEFDKFEKK